MEKDVRFWSTFIMCAGCKRKNHAFEAFFQEGKKKCVIILCSKCFKVYDERELTEREKLYCWIN
ncbi:MAG: hypothetical protein A2469_00625 [Candidatus Magasanikbacteria bacterium RIFOXYC2_FULL_40_16]|uniref:Uncharacterized protein n=1 Tax=Candidatus Magasanikbacteria bacterium RIFOXYC2_FULL_40_16 TaxID=1798703 RepID=A0A1F6P1I8_9BACT|nr:MAG: hypothetical protein A2469_00625 [Candidatus Magasanikbacteria bacterium RIFOXYC2_FULL_40_16]